MRQAKEKKKEQLVQAEKDRNRQQFQPGQAAKKKMKKIRERQAERKASKKKASENSQYFNRPISDVIAERR